MEEIIRFYEERVSTYTTIVIRLKKKIYHIGTLRLLIFVAALVTLWLCRGMDWIPLVFLILAFLLPFVALMVYHAKLSEKKAYAEEMIRLNISERKGIDYDFSAFGGASEKTDAGHSFTLDLDVFGEQSLFQSINRTVTSSGESRLAEWFMYPLDKKRDILSRQQAIRELADKSAFRQDFYVTGIVQKNDRLQEKELDALKQEMTHFSDSVGWRVMMWLIPAMWSVVIVGVGMSWLPAWTAGVMLSVSFVVASLPARRIQALCRSADKMEKLLLSYSQLIAKIEEETFESDMLSLWRGHFFSDGDSASSAIGRLSRIIGALDQRYSAIGIILNLLYLRDIRHTFLIEKWVCRYSISSVQWFDVLANMDALCSLGGFAFNHPDYPYPVIEDAYFLMEGKALGHPLLHRDKCVRNDVHIVKTPFFLVVTGANMAGKSTYLRTVGVNFLLSCMGMPVCADSLTVSPAHLVTSLRTADSLTANESYFFAELKRLKMIIDRLNAGEELFIILDEILKGTNSRDKQKGSLALMKQLIAKKTCGIIATHDLLLGTLEEEFPQEVKNYRFEADITADTLTFSYHMREGVARNMNATFLMKKMGITLSE